MRLGALLGPVADASVANTLAEQARTYVGEGLESLWSAQAVGRGFMNTDPIVTLSVAAAVTEHVELGTAVLQVPLYQPVDLAHRVFSLMQVCGNRLIFGVGAGSTESDFAAFDRPFETRFSDFSASIERLRTLFAEGGSDGVELSPWPAVKGGPPLFLGSWGNGVERAAKHFDGWIASAHYRTPDEVIAALQRYRGAGGGRAVVSTILLGPDTDLAELGDRLGRFADAGFDDAVVMFMPGGPSPAAVRALL
jgi:alkanesulfonate monooxygenase SsuD/methylene tetrahydromethanopterin reductase-like flavin-dependent oxidoreductase (luciferase family)